MAQQTINVGTSPNDGTGTPLRTAFQYTNSNFSELYTAVGPSGNNIVVPGNATITGDLTVDTSTLKVDSANNRVGVGTATPSNLFHVQGSGDIARFTNGSNNAYFAIDSAGYTLFTGAGQTGNGIYAKALTNSVQLWTNGAQRYDIDSTGVSTWSVGGSTAMTLNSTGLGVGVVPAGTGGCLQLKSGITFPATQVASSDANTLDDYEEGTFTPVVIGATSAGVGTYGTQVGYYTKVGNLVTIRAALNWTAHTGTGVMRLGGLPFNVNSPTSATSAVTFGYVDNVALAAGNILTAFAFSGTSFAECWQTPVGGGAASSVLIDTSAVVIYSLTYSV